MRNNTESLKKLISDSKKIAVVSHVNPDGDNLGSLLAMGLSLDKLGKDVVFVKADIVPKDYDFLPGIDRLQELHEDEIGSLDLLVVLDCSDVDRLGLNSFLLKKADKVVNIDHHTSNTEFGDLDIIDPLSPSTGEILYHVIKDTDMIIDKDIATLIYVAMSTDTGRFSYESVTGKTHKIVADLYEYGIDAYNINKNLYQKRTIQRTRLFTKAISNLTFHSEDRIGIVKVNRSMLEETGSTMEDTEGIVEFIRDTDSVEAACLLKEMEDGVVKISLRTKEIVDANNVCANFGGGGHKRASGATFMGSLEETEKRILEEINRYL